MVTEGVDPDALVIRKTSGSTGVPLVIRRSALEHYLLGILRVRDMLRCGVRLTHRRAVTSLMRSGDSRAQPMPADRARIRPKLVVVGGETFTDDMRRRVREGFRANVYAAYTSHEFRNIAVDCPATGRYHVCDESVIVELLRDGRPVQVGEAREVVVTGLHSYAMPFIRYPLGDLAVRGPSPCGCGAPYARARASPRPRRRPFSSTGRPRDSAIRTRRANQLGDALGVTIPGQATAPRQIPRSAGGQVRSFRRGHRAAARDLHRPFRRRHSGCL